jgi:hypothetical protein
VSTSVEHISFDETAPADEDSFPGAFFDDFDLNDAASFDKLAFDEVASFDDSFDETTLILVDFFHEVNFNDATFSFDWTCFEETSSLDNTSFDQSTVDGDIDFDKIAFDDLIIKSSVALAATFSDAPFDGPSSTATKVGVVDGDLVGDSGNSANSFPDVGSSRDVLEAARIKWDRTRDRSASRALGRSAFMFQKKYK